MSASSQSLGGVSGSSAGQELTASSVQAGRFLVAKAITDAVLVSDASSIAATKVPLDAVTTSDSVVRVVDSAPSLSDGAATSETVSLGLAMAKSDPVTSADSGSAYFDDYSIDYSPGFAGTTAAW